MTIKSFIKRLVLTEEIVEKYQSPINGEILVYEDLFGKHSMRIGGVSQSGGLVVDIWTRALREVQSSKACPELVEGFIIHNSLVLGLGCGNAAKLVSEKWPKAEITGIEIDPVVVEVGKKYFGLDKIPNLKIAIEDVFKILDEGEKCEMCREVRSEKWDLVLVDLYLGKEFPKEAESEKFINNLKNILNEKGIIVFNRFYWREYKKQAKFFEEKLKKYFSKVWTRRTVSNLLIFCQE